MLDESVRTLGARVGQSGLPEHQYRRPPGLDGLGEGGQLGDLCVGAPGVERPQPIADLGGVATVAGEGAQRAQFFLDGRDDVRGSDSLIGRGAVIPSLTEGAVRPTRRWSNVGSGSTGASPCLAAPDRTTSGVKGLLPLPKVAVGTCPPGEGVLELSHSVLVARDRAAKHRTSYASIGS
jgi:hypothetical protein